MKPVPREPMARQALSIDLLCQDIADRKSKGFDRLDALSAVRNIEASQDTPSPPEDM
jgi:hypothetical protein